MLRVEKSSQINNTSLYLKKLVKSEQIKPKQAKYLEIKQHASREPTGQRQIENYVELNDKA